MKRILFTIICSLFCLISCDTLPDGTQPDGQNPDDEAIASAQEQIAAIQKTLELLALTQDELEKYISELQKSSDVSAEDIENLKKLQNELSERMSSAEASVKEAKDWTSRTFATLEQYNDLSGTLSSLSVAVKAMKIPAVSEIEALLNRKIEESTNSMKSWINEQLTGYCTIAQTEAELELLNKAMKDEDDAMTEEIDALKKELEAMAQKLVEEYEAAIKEALENGGPLSIEGLNKKLDDAVAAINEKIVGLESRLSEIEAKVDELIKGIRSVKSLTHGAEGNFLVEKRYPFDKEGTLCFNYAISPIEAAAELAKNSDCLTMKLTTMRGEVADGFVSSEEWHQSEDKELPSIPYSSEELEIVGLTTDTEKGIISVKVAKSSFPEYLFFFGWDFTFAYSSLQLMISNGVTEINSSALTVHGYYTDYPTIPDYDSIVKNKYYDCTGGEYFITPYDGYETPLEYLGFCAYGDLIVNEEEWCTPVLDSENRLKVILKGNDSNCRRIEDIEVFTDKGSFYVTIEQEKYLSQTNLRLSTGFTDGESKVFVEDYWYSSFSFEVWHDVHEISVLSSSVPWISDIKIYAPKWNRDGQVYKSSISCIPNWDYSGEYNSGEIIIKDSAGAILEVKIVPVK